MGSIEHSTTGKTGLWNGTKDGKDGVVDYKNGDSIADTNVNFPRDVAITVHDIRHLDPSPSLMTNGYQLVSSPTTLSREDFEDANSAEGKIKIEKIYFEECGNLLKKLTGSDLVFPFNFQTRNEQAKVKDFMKDATDEPGPRPVAHVDRDIPNAIVSLQCAIGKEKADALLKDHTRWAQINVWRPIGKPVQRWPLLVANHDSIPDWDYDTHMARVYSINDPRITDRGGKSWNCVLKDDDRYAYQYVSNLAPEEALVFSSFHSDPRMVLPHGAFWDNSTPEDAPPRRSIEVRSWVFF
ncbi:hypothetical protein F5884DRAFT_801406 [Xylogone sp. PMI_703]|nr:hypothetical protein F5884DRAFT_801406 [Xylogone sp. PMI_703]